MTLRALAALWVASALTTLAMLFFFTEARVTLALAAWLGGILTQRIWDRADLPSPVS